MYAAGASRWTFHHFTDSTASDTPLSNVIMRHSQPFNLHQTTALNPFLWFFALTHQTVDPMHGGPEIEFRFITRYEVTFRVCRVADIVVARSLCFSTWGSEKEQHVTICGCTQAIPNITLLDNNPVCIAISNDCPKVRVLVVTIERQQHTGMDALGRSALTRLLGLSPFLVSMQQHQFSISTKPLQGI